MTPASMPRTPIAPVSPTSRSMAVFFGMYFWLNGLSIKQDATEKIFAHVSCGILDQFLTVERGVRVRVRIVSERGDCCFLDEPEHGVIKDEAQPWLIKGHPPTPHDNRV